MLVWETDPAMREDELGAAFADVWCAIPKVVAWPHRLSNSVRRRAAHVRCPLVIGGGTPFLPPVTEEVSLDLIEARTFGSRVICERYRRIRDNST